MKKLLFILFLILSVVGGCFAQNLTIKHTAYEIHFDTVIHEPIYTHYILTKQMLSTGKERTIFHCDKVVNCDKQGKSEDYAGSIYDRGHLSPDDDFRANTTTEVESMVYTNCAPQNKYLNRGTWKALEIYTRNLATKYNVEVWTGCIYGTQKQGSLLIPTYYWKLLKYNGVYSGYMMLNVAPASKDIAFYEINYTELLKLIR